MAQTTTKTTTTARGWSAQVADGSTTSPLTQHYTWWTTVINCRAIYKDVESDPLDSNTIPIPRCGQLSGHVVAAQYELSSPAGHLSPLEVENQAPVIYGARNLSPLNRNTQRRLRKLNVHHTTTRSARYEFPMTANLERRSISPSYTSYRSPVTTESVTKSAYRPLPLLKNNMYLAAAEFYIWPILTTHVQRVSCVTLNLSD